MDHHRANVACRILRTQINFRYWHIKVFHHDVPISAPQRRVRACFTTPGVKLVCQALRCLIRIAWLVDFLLQPAIPFIGFWHVLPFPARFTEARWAPSALARLGNLTQQ
jgi:hypothetical protein